MFVLFVLILRHLVMAREKKNNDTGLVIPSVQPCVLTLCYVLMLWSSQTVLGLITSELCMDHGITRSKFLPNVFVMFDLRRFFHSPSQGTSSWSGMRCSACFGANITIFVDITVQL